MSDMRSLLVLQEHATRERDAWQQRLHQIDTACRDAAQRLTDLIQYRGDYERRWQSSFQAGGDVQIVHHYQNFMQRLQSALEQQQAQCAHLNGQAGRVRATMLELERRVASIAKLMERRQQIQDLALQRREQKQIDEFANRVAWARRFDNPTTL